MADHTLVTQHREIVLELSTDPLPHWVAFRVCRHVIQAVRGEKASVDLLSSGLCILKHQPTKQNGPLVAMVARLFVINNPHSGWISGLITEGNTCLAV